MMRPAVRYSPAQLAEVDLLALRARDGCGSCEPRAPGDLGARKAWRLQACDGLPMVADIAPSCTTAWSHAYAALGMWHA